MITLALLAGCVITALALGFVRDYRALTEDRVEPPAQTGLPAAFEALPWDGGDDVDAYVLDEPTQAWLARWRLLHEAQQQVDVAYFILDGDVFGLSFLGALLSAADRGVKVRILVDGMATDMADMTHTLLGRNFFNALDGHPNVEVRTYRPVLERVAHFADSLRVTDLIASEHDKILNVDGEWSLTGGRNIAHAYFTPAAHAGHQFIDTDVLLKSAQAHDRLRLAFERIFELADASNGIELQATRRAIVDRARQHMDAWLNDEPIAFSDDAKTRELELEWSAALAGRPQFKGAMNGFRLPTSHRTKVRIADSVARRVPDAGAITVALISLIENAMSEIVLINPYFALGESEVRALVRAAERGVDILVVTNSPRSSDNAISQAFFLEQWPTLLARVPSMQLYVMGGDDTLHSKVMLFDRELSLVGTYNLDPTAMRMSSELMVGMWGGSMNRYFREQVARWVAAGSPAVHQYRVRLADDGKPLLDAEGEPQIEFGPEHHLSQADRAEAERILAVLRSLRKGLRLQPLIKPYGAKASDEEAASSRRLGVEHP